MKLCIPTLCRYDLLARLLASVEAGSAQPDEYVIIDNGGKLAESGLTLPANTRVIHTGENLGVARSWNIFLDEAISRNEPVIISNDDVVFNKNTFVEMVGGTSRNMFVEGDGWCLFGQTPECTQKIGHYDEHFFPAYYEDSDYDVRLQRAGVARLKVLTEPFHHDGWATTRALGDARWLSEGRERCRQYFLRKWGGRMLGENSIKEFTDPWGGDPPLGFSLRAPIEFRSPLMRYDILNRIAARIGAKRYLEIGVSTGETISRIKIPERWGVDPNPTLVGVRSSTVFVPTTSFAFLETQPRRFDLAFVDGDHRADVVVREVSLIPLTDRGVVVCHDASPSTETMQTAECHGGEWTGDVWKGIARLRTLGYEIVTVDTDYGVAIVTDRPDRRRLDGDDMQHLEWRDLADRRTSLLGLVDPFAFESWLDSVF